MQDTSREYSTLYNVSRKLIEIENRNKKMSRSR